MIELIVTRDDCQSAEEVAGGLMIVMENIVLMDMPLLQGPVLPQGWQGGSSRSRAVSHPHTVFGKKGEVPGQDAGFLTRDPLGPFRGALCSGDTRHMNVRLHSIGGVAGSETTLNPAWV